MTTTEVAGPTHCLNCGQSVADQFCGRCGQKRLVGRLSVHELWHEMVHTLLHADKSIFRFAWLALTRPGYVAKDYLAGRRRTYFNPLQFYFLIAALLIFLMVQLDVTEAMFSSANNPTTIFGQKQSAEQMAAQARSQEIVREVMVNYSTIINLVLFPFFALAIGWLFKKRRLYFAERYFVTVMALNQSSILALLLLPLTYYLIQIGKGQLGIFLPSFVCMAISFMVTLGQLFQLKWWKAILLGFLTMVLGYLAFLGVFIVLGILAVILSVVFKKNLG